MCSSTLEKRRRRDSHPGLKEERDLFTEQRKLRLRDETLQWERKTFFSPPPPWVCQHQQQQAERSLCASIFISLSTTIRRRRRRLKNKRKCHFVLQRQQHFLKKKGPRMCRGNGSVGNGSLLLRLLLSATFVMFYASPPTRLW